MGVRILANREDTMAVLYCSTSDWAFGPVFYQHVDQSLTASENAERFCHWLREHPNPHNRTLLGTAGDPRSYADHHLEELYSDYLYVLQEDAKQPKQKEVADA